MRTFGIQDERVFYALFYENPVPMLRIQPDGTIDRANEAAAAFLGYAVAELEGMTFQQITHPADLGGDLEMAQQAIRGDIDNYEMVKRYLSKQGRAVWGALYVQAIRRESDQVVEYFVSTIIPLPNHGHFKVEEQATVGSRKELIVRPSITIPQLVRDNWTWFAGGLVAIASGALTYGWRLVMAWLEVLEKTGVSY